MRRLLFLLLLLLSFGLIVSANDDLSKSKGTNQAVIEALTPFPAQTDVSRYTKIEAVFVVPLDPTSIQKNNIKLTFISSMTNSHIEGVLSYDDALHKVMFTPTTLLEPGMYEVEIKSLKADKAHKETSIGEIKYRFIVIKELLVSITINPNNNELQKGSNIQMQASGHYDSGIDRNITSKVNWTVDNHSVAMIDSNGLLTGLQEGQTKISASLNSIEGNASLEVYIVSHGHRLPPEPDSALNNSTLLGIDSNNNGVRDDVERWIYFKYDTFKPCKKMPQKVVIEGEEVEGFYTEECSETPVPYHQIVREIAMQFGRAAQIVIQDPEKARETMPYMDAAVQCNSYFEGWAKYENEPILVDHFIFDDEFKNIQFNTIKRARAFAEYNMMLSGGVYGANETGIEMRNRCDFNVTTLLKDGQ